MKRGQSGGEKKPDEIEKKEKLPEFQQVKLKKISSKAEPPKVADKKSIKDNQLKKKLDKQRQAAEGEQCWIRGLLSQLISPAILWNAREMYVFST